MCLAKGHSTMTVVPRLGIEPGTPGFESPDANHSTTAESNLKQSDDDKHFIDLSLSHIQQTTCSRRLWKPLKTLFKWKYNYWIELKTWWKKKKLLVLSNFSSCSHVFKKPSVVEASESFYMRERLKAIDVRSASFGTLSIALFFKSKEIKKTK